MCEKGSKVKVYTPTEKIDIPQAMIDKVNSLPEDGRAHRAAEREICEYVAEQMSKMTVKEVQPGKPKKIVVSKLPINAISKPIGRRDWMQGR